MILIELQNFIPHKESHHFVFCYRKVVAWQKVEYTLVLRMMAHLKFKFEVVRCRRTKIFLFSVGWKTDKSTYFDFVLLANRSEYPEFVNSND